MGDAEEEEEEDGAGAVSDCVGNRVVGGLHTTGRAYI